MHASSLLGVAFQFEIPILCVAFGDAALLIMLFSHLYTAICLMQIAMKTNTENSWWAWVPVMNILLMLDIGRKPWWWIILLLIPVVNIGVGVLVAMAICDVCGKPRWLAIGFLVPVVNLMVLSDLAFRD